MAIGDDFEVQADKDIRHVSGTSTYTVLELHRWLQDLAYDSTSVNDDFMSITNQNPSDRATDEIITLINGYNIDDNAAEYLYGGSISQFDGSVQYSGLQVLGSVNSGTTELQIVQSDSLLTNYWGTGLNNSGSTLLRILIKSRNDGVDIDGKRIRVQAREWGDTFDFFNVTLGDGEAVAAISTLEDAQNDSDATSVDSYNVTNTEGYQAIDLGQGDKYYYSKWTYNSESDGLKAFYEYSKYIQRRSSSETLYGINGELFLGITHSYDYDFLSGTPSEGDIVYWAPNIGQGAAVTNGPFVDGEVVNFQTSGAVARLLHHHSDAALFYIEIESGTPVDAEKIVGVTSDATSETNGTVNESGSVAGKGVILAETQADATTGTHYIQVLQGQAPADAQTMIVEAPSLTNWVVDGAPTSQDVPKNFAGNFTGSALFGTYGLGVDADDLTSSDVLKPLGGGTDSKPVTIDFILSGLKTGSEVRIFRVSDDTEVDGVENSTTSFTYNYQHTIDIDIYVVIFHLNWKPIRLTGLTLSTANQTIPIQQVTDRVYSNT